MQISAACSFLFLFQWWLDKGHLTRRNRRLPDDLSFLVIGCALSIAACTILSSTLAGGVYLNMAVLPAFIGILYASFRSGLSLCAYFLLCTVLFSEPPGLSAIIINSGILLYPLLFGLARPFKQAKWMEKVMLLSAVLFPYMFLLSCFPI